MSSSVLIQLAEAAHCGMLELTRNRHRRYAVQHGMDYYWIVNGIPARPRAAGWGKISLVQQALSLGYEYVVWLDADALILDTTVNLVSKCPRGIGMAVHPDRAVRQSVPVRGSICGIGFASADKDDQSERRERVIDFVAPTRIQNGLPW